MLIEIEGAPAASIHKAMEEPYAFVITNMPLDKL